MTTTTQSYRQAQQKEVTLPSGNVFTIRKVNARDYMFDANVPVQTSKEINAQTPEKNNLIWERMSDAEKKRVKDINDQTIVRAVVAPRIALAASEDELGLSELTDADYFKLIEEINAFSHGRQEIKPFRAESGPAEGTGHCGEALPSETGAAPEPAA